MSSSLSTTKRPANHWRRQAAIGDNFSAMKNLSRRRFVVAASAATLAAGSSLASAAPDNKPGAAGTRHRRVFVGSSAPDGILAFDWDPVSGELSPAGVSAKVPKVAWLASSHEHQFVYSASELDLFN